MSERWILRIQDKYGRGPWRPGFSKSWVNQDEGARPLPPTVQDEFKDIAKIVAQADLRGWSIGCGARGHSGIGKWFLPDEIERLRSKGFYLVRAHACRVLAESENQVVFASRRPLRFLPHISFQEPVGIAA
ncbi:hypothetical protein ABCW43_00245 [Neorhizobium sp. IRAMC:178]|uniref:hypothetical protein n=1 Tax=Neorhizobium tunisiense TaxID=3144793 RepID=UPI0031F6A4CB